MDAFEVFLYRSTFLDFDRATIAARLLVGVEFLIGAGLISRIKFKTAWFLAFVSTLVFCIFLAIQLAGGSDENCFCFGELMDFSPIESLLKNAVLLLLLVFVRPLKSLQFKKSALVFGLLCLLAIVLPFIMSPPDIFVSGKFKEAQHDQNALNEHIENKSIPHDFVVDKKVVAFYSMGCKFCKMSAERLSVLMRNEALDTNLVHVVFWESKSRKAADFYEETHSFHYPYIEMETKPYLDITKGRMPLLLLIENGVVIDKMNYRTMDEKTISDFLK